MAHRLNVAAAAATTTEFRTEAATADIQSDAACTAPVTGDGRMRVLLGYSPAPPPPHPDFGQPSSSTFSEAWGDGWQKQSDGRGGEVLVCETRRLLLRDVVLVRERLGRRPLALEAVAAGGENTDPSRDPMWAVPNSDLFTHSPTAGLRLRVGSDGRHIMEPIPSRVAENSELGTSAVDNSEEGSAVAMNSSLFARALYSTEQWQEAQRDRDALLITENGALTYSGGDGPGPTRTPGPDHAAPVEESYYNRLFQGGLLLSAPKSISVGTCAAIRVTWMPCAGSATATALAARSSLVGNRECDVVANVPMTDPSSVSVDTVSAGHGSAFAVQLRVQLETPTAAVLALQAEYDGQTGSYADAGAFYRPPIILAPPPRLLDMHIEILTPLSVPRRPDCWTCISKS